MIKVDVISGFLGAGKTTLIKKIFETVLDNEKVVLIENEFGEIGIDGSFLKESGIQIKEINAGCICCSLVGDFETSMKEVINTYHPERIIIEPSGVGKLSDIINAILKIDELQINILATVVDGVKTKMYLKNFGEFFNNQVEAANTIIISKTDKMSEEKVLEVVELIKEKNDDATIITTAIKDLDSATLIKVLESKSSLKDEMIKEVQHSHHHSHHCCCEHEHHHEHEEHDCCCGHHHEHEHHHDHEEHDCCCGHHHEHEHHHDHKEHDCCCGHHHEHHHDHEEHDCCCGHHHEHHEHSHHHNHQCGCEEHHHDHEQHHADEVFTSWGKETAKSVSYNELKTFLDTLANDESLGIIIRSKGILKANDNENWYYYDFVSGDYEIREGKPDYTGRIVVIGSKMDEHRIEELFFGGK